jgi:hypothetical protein
MIPPSSLYLGALIESVRVLAESGHSAISIAKAVDCSREFVIPALRKSAASLPGSAINPPPQERP